MHAINTKTAKRPFETRANYEKPVVERKEHLLFTENTGYSQIMRN